MRASHRADELCAGRRTGHGHPVHGVLVRRRGLADVIHDDTELIIRGYVPLKGK